MLETITIDCPYCGERYATQVDLSAGSQSYVEDCAVCCRPWLVTVERERGRLRVQVGRAQ